jgi:membrane protein implicated in regulation of membrane protease activity
MDQANWWVMDIVGPAILLVVLVWLVIRVRSNRDNRDNQRSEQGTRNLYQEEEQRRRDGTDKL